MVSTSWFALLTLIPSLATALPFRLPNADSEHQPQQQQRRRGFTLPIERRRVARSDLQTRDDGLAGTVGIGDIADLFYTVAIQVGESQTAVNLDTGSSDLWVMSDACNTKVCKASTSQPYKASSGKSTGADVSLQYGDSTSGTHAKGPVVLDTVAVAGLSLADQPLGAINDTDNSAVQNGGAGIFGMGFPSQSFVQAAVVNQKFNSPTSTDDFIQNIGAFGPLVSRLAEAGHIEQPIFSISLQRNTVDVGGKGQITIGELPAGVDNSNVTWVPVRLYKPTDGGLNPPSFAKNETYPLRWEVPIDGVFLDGKQLPDTKLTGTSPQLSALIDTGNSILRGPQDVVTNILSTVSPSFAKNPQSAATFPCATAHTLSFKIGGKLFPVDPRDFVSSQSQSSAKVCTASNVVSTDPPASGALFSWSLGDPFLKSTTVIFYYGNLTHPSVDPPKIGFVSNVPTNADDLLEQAVEDAQASGGVFESTVEVAPTASTVVTLSAPATASPASSSLTAAPSSSAAVVDAQATPSPTPAAASSAASPSASDKKDNGALGGVSIPSSRTLMLVLAVVPLLSMFS